MDNNQMWPQMSKLRLNFSIGVYFPDFHFLYIEMNVNSDEETHAFFMENILSPNSGLNKLWIQRPLPMNDKTIITAFWWEFQNKLYLVTEPVNGLRIGTIVELIFKENQYSFNETGMSVNSFFGCHQNPTDSTISKSSETFFSTSEFMTPNMTEFNTSKTTEFKTSKTSELSTLKTTEFKTSITTELNTSELTEFNTSNTTESKTSNITKLTTIEMTKAKSSHKPKHTTTESSEESFSSSDIMIIALYIIVIIISITIASFFIFWRLKKDSKASNKTESKKYKENAQNSGYYNKSKPLKGKNYKESKPLKGKTYIESNKLKNNESKQLKVKPNIQPKQSKVESIFKAKRSDIEADIELSKPVLRHISIGFSSTNADIRKPIILKNHNKPNIKQKPIRTKRDLK